MIDFEKFELDNGLRVVVHEDLTTPLVAVNVLYDVGSRDEDPEKTGFAHLFEHLMFGGSVNIKDFDIPIQNAGGENNAFTNTDITNFYNVLPAQNIETAFWLESDRMLQLRFDPQVLETQKKVVVEEFKETTLNKPYGDLWHSMTDLAYKNHSYRWPTIGLKPEHINDANMDDVSRFYRKHYNPNNAILSISGNIKLSEAKRLTQKWFGPIPAGNMNCRSLEYDIEQTGLRKKTLKSDVPADALYFGFPMPGRAHQDFPIYDLISELLSEGASSRFQKDLVKKADLFSHLYTYLSGTIDPGLFIIDARLLPSADMQRAKNEIWNVLEDLKEGGVQQRELEKIKNKLISSTIFSDVSILNKAINLAFYELIGDANLVNQQIEMYEKVSPEDIQRVARLLFTEAHLNEIEYLRSEA